MKLGLAISHDASAAITTDQGEIISAIGEERITRVKNHVGLPVNAIELLTRSIDSSEFTECVIGTNKNLTFLDAKQILFNLDGNPSNPAGKWLPVAPGQKNNLLFYGRTPYEIIENKLKSDFPEVFMGMKFTWENHHDSHLGCALGMSNNKERLLISLDNAGDGESGAIGLTKEGSFRSLQRISSLDSLGALYSAVTEKYNFRQGSHEGKITGLAALGSHSEAVEILSQFVSVKNGRVKVVNVHKLKDVVIGKVASKFGLSLKTKMQLDQIIDLAESKTVNYADLAYAIQFILEKSVLELVSFWIRETGTRDLALSGGVFANVKLNQRISELDQVNDVQIFPNMGDGGIAVGGIWSQLAKRGHLSEGALFTDMYLAPNNIDDDHFQIQSLKSDPLLVTEFFPSEALSNDIAHSINSGFIVAFHNGQMEFGPRALGNRSLLIDPRRKDLVSVVNKRLRRTEFMPFAPIVLEEKFNEYFIKSDKQSITPFQFMTMTCNVRNDYWDKIPAVTHRDGTARPQSINKDSNGIIHDVISDFGKITGIYLLVNTSLNIHEEPINYSLNDSIKALKSDAFDILYFDNIKITLAKV
jgi:carbamoyltransferase